MRRGPDAGLYSRRARLHYRRRRYEAAVRDLRRALRLAPRDGGLYAQRSELLSQLGRPHQARRDLEAAIRISPADESLRLARLRLLLAGGLRRQAWREVRRLGSRGGMLGREALFSRGCLFLQEGSFRQAAGDFMRAMGPATDTDSLSLRARFYWIVARGAEDAAHEPGPRLYLVGLGLFPPYTASLEAVRLLAGCDVVLNNISGPETQELLCALGPKVRPSTYDNRGDDALWARRIVAHLERGAVTAFVTRGHPLVFGDLGAKLIQECRRRDIPCRTLASLSSLDILPARMAQRLAVTGPGLQACEWQQARGGTVDPRRPLLVYFFSPPKAREIRRLQGSLARAFGAGHPCWMFGPQYAAEPQALRVRELACRYPLVDPSLVLYLPAAGFRP
jgi:hypothetical protein